MSLTNFLLMRHELLLTIAALSILMAEIFWDPGEKRSKNLFSVVLFIVITIIGFLPSLPVPFSEECMKFQIQG